MPSSYRLLLNQYLNKTRFQDFKFYYVPLHFFAFNYAMEILLKETPVLRALLSKDLTLGVQ